MQDIDIIRETYTAWSKTPLADITKLPPSWSNRTYARITTDDQHTYIWTYNTNVVENEAFIAFTKHFLQAWLPVPDVYSVHTDRTAYIQKDVWTVCLMDIIKKDGEVDSTYVLCQQALSALAKIQILWDESFPYEKCITAKEFGQQAILSDLLYFKYYFLDLLQLPYDKQRLLEEFEAFANYLHHTEYKYFMFRDFQSRNIMIDNTKAISFIDYQWGMKGALQYDVASFLWQAKANFSEARKASLLEHYIAEANKLLQHPIDTQVFTSQYYGFVLVRMLQVLWAYGFRWIFERKTHFLISIPWALRNIRHLMQDHNVGIIMPTFIWILEQITSDEMIAQFEVPQATRETPLRVTINSFSYKRGIPEDSTGNGWWFVIDCRGLDNPWKIAEYKGLSGQDTAVIQYLAQQNKMDTFLQSIRASIDMTIEKYLERNFENLQINFGCTWWQHRSVYAAEKTAQHLQEKYNLKITPNHTNKENRVLH